MKAETILHALGGISDEAIRDAKAPAGARRIGWMRWVAAAACLCLVIAAAGTAAKLFSPTGESPLSSETEKGEAPGPASEPEAPFSYPGSEPLPPENEKAGGGGGSFKSQLLLCRELSQILDPADAVSPEELAKLSGMPVYRDVFFFSGYERTDAVKTGLQKTAEEYLRALGYEESVEKGLTPNSYLWNESEKPMFSTELPEISITVSEQHVSVKKKIAGIGKMEKQEVIETLLSDPAVALICRKAGVSDPAVSMSSDHSWDGSSVRSVLSIYDRADARGILTARAFPPISISVDGSVVIMLRSDSAAEYIGEYPIVPPEKAAEEMYQKYGIEKEDVLGYQIEYSNHITEGYYVPYYKFYFEEEMEDLPSGLMAVHEYCVRAVEGSGSWGEKLPKPDLTGFEKRTYLEVNEATVLPETMPRNIFMSRSERRDSGVFGDRFFRDTAVSGKRPCFRIETAVQTRSYCHSDTKDQAIGFSAKKNY